MSWLAILTNSFFKINVMKKVRLKNTPYIMDVDVENKEEFVETLNKLMSDFILDKVRFESKNEEDYTKKSYEYFYKGITDKFGSLSIYYEYINPIYMLCREIVNHVDDFCDVCKLEQIDLFEVSDVTYDVKEDAIKYIPINEEDNNFGDFINTIFTLGAVLPYVVLAPMLASGKLKY